MTIPFHRPALREGMSLSPAHFSLSDSRAYALLQPGCRAFALLSRLLRGSMTLFQALFATARLANFP